MSVPTFCRERPKQLTALAFHFIKVEDRLLEWPGRYLAAQSPKLVHSILGERQEEETVGDSRA
jgi:hypothetical protein